MGSNGPQSRSQLKIYFSCFIWRFWCLVTLNISAWFIICSKFFLSIIFNFYFMMKSLTVYRLGSMRTNFFIIVKECFACSNCTIFHPFFFTILNIRFGVFEGIEFKYGICFSLSRMVMWDFRYPVIAGYLGGTQRCIPHLK